MGNVLVGYSLEDENVNLQKIRYSRDTYAIINVEEENSSIVGFF